AWRAVEQDVIQGFAAAAGGFDGDGDVLFYPFLADVFIEAFGADAGFDAGVFVVGGAGDDSVLLVSVWHSFCAGVGHYSIFLQTQGAGRSEGRRYACALTRRHGLCDLSARLTIAGRRGATFRNLWCLLRAWLRLPQLRRRVGRRSEERRVG